MEPSSPTSGPSEVNREQEKGKKKRETTEREKESERKRNKRGEILTIPPQVCRQGLHPPYKIATVQKATNGTHSSPRRLSCPFLNIFYFLSYFGFFSSFHDPHSRLSLFSCFFLLFVIIHFPS